MNQTEPLAYRIRPKTLEEYVGQEHVLGEGKILYRTIKADRLSSIILFGPPGCGKTSLAKVISETTKYKFYKIKNRFYNLFFYFERPLLPLQKTMQHSFLRCNMALLM